MQAKPKVAKAPVEKAKAAVTELKIPTPPPTAASERMSVRELFNRQAEFSGRLIQLVTKAPRPFSGIPAPPGGAIVFLSGHEYPWPGKVPLALANNAYWFVYEDTIEVLPSNPTTTLQSTLVQYQRMSRHRKIGGDPEVFVTVGDVVLPAFEFLPSMPEAQKISAKNAGIMSPYWDGYQAEFSYHPQSCQSWTMDAIRHKLHTVLLKAREVNKQAHLSVRTTVDIPPERLSTDDPKFVMFGCNPSLNAYKERHIIPDAFSVPFRSSGGHLHLDIYDPKKNASSKVKLLDRTLGVIAVALLSDYDDARRRMLYGRAGEYRLKPYGIEYRVLSSAWLVHPGIAHLVHEMARIVTEDVGALEREWGITEVEARTCINATDVSMARELLRKNIEQVHALFAAAPHRPADPASYLAACDGLLFEGVRSRMKDPDQFSPAWCLENGTWINHSDGPRATWSSCSTFLAETGKLD